MLDPLPPENIASAEEVVESAKKDLKSAMMEHGEATDSLCSLLERAKSLGLRSKVRSAVDLKSSPLSGEPCVSQVSVLIINNAVYSKVEQIEGKIAEFASELLAGVTAIAEVESRSKVLEDYQQEVQKSKEQLQR